jgi:hypothetical protein
MKKLAEENARPFYPGANVRFSQKMMGFYGGWSEMGSSAQ